MNRDYIDWLETLPCSCKRQPINTGWVVGLRYLTRLICLLTRIGRIGKSAQSKGCDVSPVELGQ